MTKFFAGVLSVIAIGTLLIAYGLFNLNASAFNPRANVESFAQPRMAGERMPVSEDPYAMHYSYSNGPVPAMRYGYAPYGVQPAAYPMNEVRPIRTGDPAPVRRVATREGVNRLPANQRVDRQARRDWKKTALVIGGSTAGAAGLGGIFGGKKGALIGAAIGGGASTIYEATKR